MKQPTVMGSVPAPAVRCSRPLNVISSSLAGLKLQHPCGLWPWVTSSRQQTRITPDRAAATRPTLDRDPVMRQ